MAATQVLDEGVPVLITCADWSRFRLHMRRSRDITSGQGRGPPADVCCQTAPAGQIHSPNGRRPAACRMGSAIPAGRPARLRHGRVRPVLAVFHQRAARRTHHRGPLSGRMPVGLHELDYRVSGSVGCALALRRRPPFDSYPVLTRPTLRRLTQLPGRPAQRVDRAAGAKHRLRVSRSGRGGPADHQQARGLSIALTCGFGLHFWFCPQIVVNLPASSPAALVLST